VDGKLLPTLRAAPKFPTDLPGRLATVMLNEHPEGRWGTVDEMWRDMLKHPVFRGDATLKHDSKGDAMFVKKNVEKALALLVEWDSETWARKPSAKVRTT
jgi:hypothetical protein